MKRRMFLLAALAVLLVAMLATAAVAAAPTTVQLQPVNNSGVTGTVVLTPQSPSGTHIDVTAAGLSPGKRYVSLTYGNHDCALERYSTKDIIGRPYMANMSGDGHVSGDVPDNLDQINSVSVRQGYFKLLACADVHPG